MPQTEFFVKHRAVVNAALAALEKQRFMQRLWTRDPSIWSSDPEVQKAITNRLGWMGIADVMAGNIGSIQQAAQEIRAAGFTHAVLLGMGGSGLFAEVCRETLGITPGHLKLTVLDSTDAAAVKAARAQCAPGKLLAVISSKSGGTAEISALSKFFYGEFKSSSKQPGSQCVVITDASTALEEQAKQWQVRKLFVHDARSGSDVGGRFSALTYFGLVPAALMGINIEKLIRRGQAMFTACGPSVAIGKNQAVVLGAALGAFALQGRNKMRLLCPPRLSSFGTWVEQLIAESTGKLGKGIAPICGEKLRPAGQYRDDEVFVELQLAGQINKPVEKAALQLIKAGRPVIRIQYEDAYDLGGEAVKWEIATAAAGAVMSLNPFDEPNVKESKDRTKALLAAYSAERVLADEKPIAVDKDVELYGSLAQGTRLVDKAVKLLLKNLKQGDTITVLSFLSRSAGLDKQIHALRESIASKSGRATMLGFGPRYLHSTGQLYKGGPDNSVFLFLTGDDPVDLPIPGEAFSFNVLKKAQALGDFQALQEKKRRVLRLHIKGSLQAGLRRLIKAL